jgi:hypothetical protein
MQALAACPVRNRASTACRAVLWSSVTPLAVRSAAVSRPGAVQRYMITVGPSFSQSRPGF